MSKVLLTRAQAESVESFRNYGHTLEFFEKNKGTFYKDRYSSLNDVTLDDLAKALYIGYEIESEQPKFNVNDKLYSPIKGILNVIYCSGNIFSVKEFSYPLPADEYRIATPEEIYWLENLGRDKVMDFWHGDMLLYKNMETRCLTESHDYDYAKEDYEAGLISGIYPSESFKSCPQEEKK